MRRPSSLRRLARAFPSGNERGGASKKEEFEGLRGEEAIAYWEVELVRRKNLRGAGGRKLLFNEQGGANKKGDSCKYG